MPDPETPTTTEPNGSLPEEEAPQDPFSRAMRVLDAQTDESASAAEDAVATPPADEAPKEPEIDPSLRRNFAALATKERQIQERASEVKQLEQSLKPIQEAAAIFSSDPIGALTALAKAGGWTGDDVVDHIIRASLDGGRPTNAAEAKVRQELEELRREIQADKEAKEQAATSAQQQAAVQKYQGDITSFLDENAEAFPLTAGLRRGDLVFQRAVSYAQATGGQQPPPFEQLASEVEARLLQEVKDTAPKLLGIPSIRQVYVDLLGATPPEAAPPPASPPALAEGSEQGSRPQASGPRTVGNHHASQAPPRAKEPPDESEAARRKRAIARLEGREP